jgi:hypothetical protein
MLPRSRYCQIESKLLRVPAQRKAFWRLSVQVNVQLELAATWFKLTPPPFGTPQA